MRHGRPLFDLDELRGQKFAPSDITQILLDYEQTDLAPDCSPPNDAIELANACAAHFSSQLPRAKASIERLGLRHKAQTDPLFAESSMPHTLWTRPKLDALIWSVTFRLAWLVGFSHALEIFSVLLNAKGNICIGGTSNPFREEELPLELPHTLIKTVVVNHRACPKEQSSSHKSNKGYRYEELNECK